MVRKAIAVEDGCEIEYVEPLDVDGPDEVRELDARIAELERLLGTVDERRQEALNAGDLDAMTAISGQEDEIPLLIRTAKIKRAILVADFYGGEKDRYEATACRYGDRLEALRMQEEQINEERARLDHQLMGIDGRRHQAADLAGKALIERDRLSRLPDPKTLHIKQMIHNPFYGRPDTRNPVEQEQDGVEGFRLRAGQIIAFKKNGEWHDVKPLPDHFGEPGRVGAAAEARQLKRIEAEAAKAAAQSDDQNWQEASRAVVAAGRKAQTEAAAAAAEQAVHEAAYGKPS